MKPKTKLLILAAVLALFGIIVLYVLELHWFQNSFGASRLVIGALVVGLGVGCLLGYKYEQKGGEQVEKMQIWSVCIILSMLLMPLLASLTNRLLAGQPTPTKVQFWEEKAYFTNRYGILQSGQNDPAGYFIFLIKDGEMVRLESKTPQFASAQKGDTVEISVRKGLLGIKFAVLDN